MNTQESRKTHTIFANIVFPKFFQKKKSKQNETNKLKA